MHQRSRGRGTREPSVKRSTPKRLAKNGQIGCCFDELDEWGLGLFGEIRACGPGFRTEEIIVRDFVRGVLDPEGITGGPVSNLGNTPRGENPLGVSEKG
jgi:hypothetical protein